MNTPWSYITPPGLTLLPGLTFSPVSQNSLVYCSPFGFHQLIRLPPQLHLSCSLSPLLPYSSHHHVPVERSSEALIQNAGFRVEYPTTKPLWLYPLGLLPNMVSQVLCPSSTMPLSDVPLKLRHSSVPASQARKSHHSTRE